MSIPVRIQALGNEGFLVQYSNAVLIFDPISDDIPSKALTSQLNVDFILVTHDHWDHFNLDLICKIARPTTRIIGPQPVANILRKHKMAKYVIEMEPLKYGTNCHLKINNVDITAFKTVHSKSHNSYLVSFPAFRFFHDGDNERTDILPVEQIGKLNVLFLCPWQGSEWEKFIERLKPEHWIIMHLTESEYDELERGVFFDGITDHVPMAPLVLRPGEKIEL
jgi:L-ascorbate metabolism protein UlaG (beta-lactamase superfamily)